MRAKKFLSQNFLVDPNTQRRIVEACQLHPSDMVLEIGPGQGAITERIIPQVSAFYAVETDRELYEALTKKYPQPHLHWIHQDFLKFDLSALPNGMKVVGNLPYHISTPIIEKLIEHQAKIKEAFCLVQWEFGRRMVAKPNSKEYGSLSCFVQYHADAKILFKVPPGVFRPRPKVDSCLVKLTFRQFAQKPKNEKLFFELIRHAFQQRRKKIGNALMPMIGKEMMDEVMRLAKIDQNARAENLGIKNYVQIADIYFELQGKEKKG